MIISDRKSEKTPAAAGTFFPLFIDMGGRKVLVIGGGKVAGRRIKGLVGFGAEITVITPEAAGYIENAAASKAIRLIRRKYKKGDVAALMPFFVIAATGSRQVNHAVMAEAKSLDTPVSVADCREECTCFFPAIAESGDYIAGLVSKNGSHRGAAQTAKKIREFFAS
ncbi:MAG: bifunctional precorrin-2 dehydrogenase/sirohydrochlorin ferrochelatase [Treponema sp.]|nr:bifunctional precorrin-2 dehydrogenase/sirohydrochlorin ferrochelatase [Treponema sp.]